MNDMMQPATILDGAVGDPDALTADIESQRRIAADPNQSLDVRLEAYEDIIDSQVGDTSLVRARNVERNVGMRQLFLKFEGGQSHRYAKGTASHLPRAHGMPCDADLRAITMADLRQLWRGPSPLRQNLAGLRCIVFYPRKLPYQAY